MWQTWTQNEILALISFILLQLAMIFAAGHAILYKRDPRSSIGWAGLIILVPGVGALLYWFFGVNRLRKKAQKISRQEPWPAPFVPAKKLLQKVKAPKLSPNIERLLLLTDNVIQENLSSSNQAAILINGEEAYPAMLEAIENATRTVALSTYIFDNDKVGRKFAAELKAAGERGVTVRVLIDDIGARYSFPTIMKTLKGKNIKAHKFHRTFWPWRFHYAQLRNHRKLLVVDGDIGFIGGMNIRDDHMVSSAKQKEKTQDLHFKVEGPVLESLQRVFLKDWSLAAKEKVDLSVWSSSGSEGSKSSESGEALMRAIPDGPDEHFDKLRWTMLGAIASAESSVSIVTPYFLPDQALITALGVSALKGINVEIVIPRKNNHKLVQWACIANLWQVMERGCKVYLAPEPFDHSKIFLVDGQWALIGSSNWDARSFRLNFELNLECYDQSFVQELDGVFRRKKALSKGLELEDIEKRSFPIKLRDALARLFTPYL